METKKSRHGLIAETSCRLCLIIPKEMRDRIKKVKCANENFSDTVRHCLEQGLNLVESNK